jgi:hypothetical protein
MTRGEQEAVRATLQMLKALSEVDLRYADRYLDRAELLLPQLLTREEYLRLRHDRDALPRAADALRQAIDSGDLARVRTLAEGAAQQQRRLAASEEVLQVADAVYGPRVLRVSPTVLALSGIVAHPSSVLERECAAVVNKLRALAAADPAWSAFYAARATHFERLEVVAEEHPLALLPPDQTRAQLLSAVEKADFTEVGRLTDTLIAETQSNVPGRVRVPPPPDSHAQALSVPLPSRAVDRARNLGLTQQTVSAARELNAYLSCRCGERPTLPEVPLSEGHRTPRGCTCGHACPPEVRPALRESLDWLLLHPFMSFTGSRYLPWFGTETLLVETFPEAEPDASSPLLESLGLPRRCGLSRMAIEDALRVHTAQVCTQLELDPFEFVLACIPFDVYVRLASIYGWGREHLWTHFDGYQVTRELTLLALVGGDITYGGADDLCAVQRNYDAERITTRFCVVRRQRFLECSLTAPSHTSARI